MAGFSLHAPQRRSLRLVALLSAVVVPAAAVGGCLGPQYTAAGTALWEPAEEGIVKVGERLYHYRTVYYPEPDTLHPQEEGYEVVFQDVRFYLLLVNCAITDIGIGCAIRAAIYILDLIYDEEIAPPQGLPSDEGQVYLDDERIAGLLWQGGQAVRLLVEA